MTGIKRMAVLALALMVCGAVEVMAQPGGGGRGGGGGGGGGPMMAMRFVPIEQVLGFLAFDEQVGLSNDQLLKARNELMLIHAKRAELMKNAQGGNDRDAMMSEVQKLRGEMTQKLTAVLQPKQVEYLKSYMQQLAPPAGGGGGGGQRGEWGGQRGR